MVGKEAEIISILGSSQGVISVVSALLAGVSGTMLTCVTEDALARAGNFSYLFMLSGAMGAALNLGTAIICIISEQESKVAYAFSLLRDSEEFDKDLEAWWRDFALLRTAALWCFLYSVPLTFFTMACQCYITHLNMLGLIGFFVFNAVGGAVAYHLFGMNRLFRDRVLQMNSNSTHSAPIYCSRSKVVIGAVSSADVGSITARSPRRRSSRSSEKITEKRRLSRSRVL